MISQILDGASTQYLSSKEIKSIRETISTISKWDGIKKTGEAAIPAGDATVAFKRLKQTLQLHGIYLVPVGELECFIKDIGGHGPEWVNDVLEAYPNLDAPMYDSIKDFIGSINL